MEFDKEAILTRVNELLEEIPLPGTPKGLVSAGTVERVIARPGQLSVILTFPAGFASSREEIKRAIESRLRGLPGIENIQILEKATQPGAPAQQGREGAPPGAEGVPGVRYIIAVASGKGGVGKSTIAVNLAVELGRQGHRTALLDCDVYGPSIPKMLGLEGQRPQVAGKDRILPLTAHGIETISIGFMLDDDAPVIWRGPMVTGLLKQFLFQVEWGNVDYMILDLPPGTGDAQLTMVQSIALSGGIIVTTPQDVALLDVQRGIQMFQRVEVPILGIVENMSGFRCPNCGHEARIFSAGGGQAAAKRYSVPFLGSIPLDPSYVEACDRGEPVVLTDREGTLSVVMEKIAATVHTRFP